MLRGVNVSGDAKLPPFLPFKDLSKLAHLKSLGFNVIRLLFIWEAYEPVQGQYDELYLRRISDIVDAAYGLGIYTIIDMHQDAFSRHYGTGCGDGFPAWVVPASVRKEATGAEQAACDTMWAPALVSSRAMHQSYRAFYANESGVRDAFIETWKRVASAFKDNRGVIGYDLLNEPWGYEAEEISPLYEDVAKAIQPIDPEALLFLDPSPATVFGNFASRLARPSFENAVYAPHFYHVGTALLNDYDKAGGPKLVYRAFERMAEKAGELQAPLFVGEFGVSPEARGAERLMDLQYELLDAGFVSGTQWNYTAEWTPKNKDGWNKEDFSIVDDKGKLRSNFKLRPYPRVIAGRGTSFKVHWDKRGAFDSFELIWEQDVLIGETVVYFPAEELVGAAEVKVDGGSNLVCAVGVREIRCWSLTNGSQRLVVSR